MGAPGTTHDHPAMDEGTLTLATQCPELPEGALHPTGFMPYWTVAADAEQAVYGLCYILQQIQATNTYRPNIGQVSAAMSSLEFAIRALKAEHLIAADPDLLEALKDARAQLEGYERHVSGEDYNDPRINAAIAKAEGQS